MTTTDPQAPPAGDPPPATPAYWRTPSRWTLRTKLVASMVALFAAIAVVTGAAAVWSLDTYLTRQTDDALRTALERAPSPVEQDEERQPTRRRGPGDEGLMAVIDGSSGYGQATSKGARVSLTAAHLLALDNAQIGAIPKDVELSGLGEYRVVANSHEGLTVIVGLARGPQRDTIRNAIGTLILTTVVGLVVMGLLGTWRIRRTLRPLDQVAATAQAVAELPLHQGKVALAERVPDRFTDTRTEVGKVGSAVNEMLDHITEALTARHRSEQRVRQFVADASHELRTPLASIKGYAELTRKEADPVPTGVSYAIGRIESEATRMSSLVEDLLLLARLDAGRELQAEPVDLSQLVVDAVSDAHAASPDHSWQLDLPPDPVETVGDPARLHQVIANLLANARTHTPQGTTVVTRLRVLPDRVAVSVHDDGPGVPAALQANVFERFARGDTSRNRAAGSTGLGLSIVAAVAQAHGGSVELRSVPGDTTFTLFLPRR